MGGVVWSQAVHSAETTHLAETPNAVEVQDDATGSDRKMKLEEDMRKFKEEMAQKRDARKEAIQNLNKRIKELQENWEQEHGERMKLEEELKTLRECRGEELKQDDPLQCAESDVQVVSKDASTATEWGEEDSSEAAPAGSTKEEEISGSEQQDPQNEEDISEQDKDEMIEGLERQVKALKDVAVIGGEMLRIRELQVNELKSKLEAIEETGIAYEKEVENMKKLRNLYEERARAMTISHEMELEREKQKTLAAETRQKLAEHRSSDLEAKNKEVEERKEKIEKDLDQAKMDISDLKIKLAGKSDDLYSATSQLAVVNHLFGQLFSPKQDSLEKITKVLEEHHDLVNHLTGNGKINELASTLVEIADKDPMPVGSEHDMSEHLTKVWRLLVELLGHHIVKPAPEEAPPESCYKSVDTPSGPKMVISVSQTFLRLKDLILEKNSLMKEVGRLKDLNSTLESRLSEQESRLSLVTTELHTTWGVVNKLKRQHQNLHSHEQVLRYELAQKRLLLNDLKKQLEECKENWSLARAKNNQTEKDWKLLRSEFALRKQQASSAESGYEESPSDSQDEEEWKELPNQSVSSDEEHCEVLSWTEAEEPRSERRGTLTNVSQSDESSERLMDFSADEVDHCAVLPWTDQEESPVGNSATDELSSTGATRGDSASKQGGQVLSYQQPIGSLARLVGSPEVELSNSSNQSGWPPDHSRLAGTSLEPTHSRSPNEPQPSTSQRTAEEILQARQDRLQRLEEGCKGLFNKMSQTNQRSTIINNRLTELHEMYGEESRTGSQLNSQETSSDPQPQETTRTEPETTESPQSPRSSSSPTPETPSDTRQDPADSNS